MSGLPRAGSTLLSSLLNQNNEVYSGPSSPVVPTMLSLENSFNQDELFLAYPKVQQGKNIISSILPQYYTDTVRPIVIDKNRSWVNRPEYIQGYFGIEPKIICPVRDISEVVASFVALCERNDYRKDGKINFIDKNLLIEGLDITNENRARQIAGPGILGQSYDAMKAIVEAGNEKILHFVEYKDLLESPQETMNKIYDFLGEERWTHNFDEIENIHQEKDKEVYGLGDMHTVRPNLARSDIKPSDYLSDEILELCKDQEFWRKL